MMERAQTAEMLLTHPMVSEILATLFAAAQSDLLAAQPGDLTALRAHARMLGLKAVRDGLTSIVNDAKVAGLSDKTGDK